MSKIVFISGLGVSPNIALNFLNKITSPDKIVLLHYPEILSDSCSFDTALLIKRILQLDSQLPRGSILIGWSMGGLIAALLAYIGNNKYLSYIAIATSPKFTSSESWEGISQESSMKFCRLAKSNFDKLWSHFVANIVYPDFSRKLISVVRQHACLDQTEFQVYLDLLLNMDIRDIVSQISIKSLYIFGGLDVIVPFQVADYLIKNSSNIDVCVLKNAGHALFCTHEEEVVRIVLDFMATSFMSLE